MQERILRKMQEERDRLKVEMKEIETFGLGTQDEHTTWLAMSKRVWILSDQIRDLEMVCN